MTEPESLVSWLLRQISTEEQEARIPQFDRDPTYLAWHVEVQGSERRIIAGDGCREGVMNKAAAGHVARWDPARVLAEAAAKRAIIAALAGAWEGSECTECNEAGYLADSLLRLLTGAYRDRPGYRDEWGVTE